ncbi:MAG TPA: transglutaminase-like domain-containing protein [Gemmatimonadales bacterium]|nr:transglutaminase-like domain-containing protein [Gemmatimonadales bacterium]
MTRRAWAIAILSAWAASLGWLVKRQLFRPAGARLAEAALSVPPGAVYYRLDVAGQQVGFASSTIDTMGTSVQVTDVLVLHVSALGVLYRTVALSRATLSRALRLERVDAKFDGDVGQFTARGIVTGDTMLALTLGSGADSNTLRIRLARPIALPSVLPLRLAFGGELRPGRTYSLAAFDPMLLEQRAVHVTVAAESTLVVADSAEYDSTAMAWVPAHFDTVRAFRIDETWGDARTRAWVDAQGHIVRAEAPAGFTMTRSAFELAYVNFRHRDTVRVARASAAPRSGDVVATTVITAHGTLRGGAVPLMRYRLSAKDVAGREAAGRQRLLGDTLVVRRQGVEDLRASYRLPARDTGLAAFLTPEPLIESADPRIEAQARLIVGREREPARAARLILDWVHDNVRPAADAGLPSALGALASRRGDCNAYTVLYVALARAAGIPARTAAGLLYLGGRFYYHAWPEVLLADWVAVDPAADQFPADAAHIRFAIGGLARQAELIRLVGGLKLEVP